MPADKANPRPDQGLDLSLLRHQLGWFLWGIGAFTLPLGVLLESESRRFLYALNLVPVIEVLTTNTPTWLRIGMFPIASVIGAAIMRYNWRTRFLLMLPAVGITLIAAFVYLVTNMIFSDWPS